MIHCRLPQPRPRKTTKAKKKKPRAPRLNRLCQPCATPSSNSSLDHRRSAARIVENGFATSGGVSKSAKVVLSADYQKKDWCGVEFRAVREIIFARENTRIMFVRTDDGAVEGVFKTDGYVDARKFEPSQIAEFICQRLDVLRKGTAPR